MDKQQRLLSLDSLRGFDMFWITGGSSLVVFLAKYTGYGWVESLAEQMEHVPWNGLHFYDLIFPLFIFISGVAIPFSLMSKLEKNVPKYEIVKKSFTRALLLVLLGFIYNGVFQNGFENPRFASVLGQIGLSYFFTVIITIYSKSLKQRLCWLVGILIGIGMVHLFIHVPGIGAGVMTPEGCINGYIDRMLLPGILYGKTFDPEGLLCIISAVSVTLMGSMAGFILRDLTSTEQKKIWSLFIIGISTVLFATLLSTFYPFIKACWTGSFNLLAGGIGFLLITLFYWLIDVMGWIKWSFFFRVIGMNSIFIYLLYALADTQKIAKNILGWTVLWGDFGQLVNMIGNITLVWLILFFMYKKNLFLKI